MSGNVNVTRLGPEAMADNPSRVDVADYTSGFREFKPTQPRDDWRIVAITLGGSVAAFLVLWLAYGIWKSLYCWLGGFDVADTCRAMARTEPVALGLLGALVVGVVTWRAITAHQAELRQRRAYANRTGLVLDRFGNQTPADLYDRMDLPVLLTYLDRRYQQDVALKKVTAPYEIYWGVNALTEGDAPEREALPAPAGASLVPIDEWLGWVNDPDGEPHLMISGKTKAGKSTLAEALLAARVARGDEVYIIDPHYAPVNKYGETPWCGLHGEGGDSWDSVRAALAGVRSEYERRKLAANQGEMPDGGFRPLTVVIDEAPEIYEELPKEWESFQGVMGSGARKYSIYLIVITQSHLIKDIGGSTAKRENFTVIALNEKAKLLILSEQAIEHDEKRQLLDTVIGMEWAAAMLRNNELYLLDRAAIRERRPKRLNAALWQPPCAPAEPPTEAEAKLEMLRGLRAAGWKRDEVRASGLQFDNDQWTAAAP